MGVIVRPLVEADLPDADRILRMAFGTFLGLPDPMAFLGDGDYVRTRWLASPDSAFVAEIDGRLVGSNFATRWGSFAYFGPLTIDPQVQDQGYGSELIHPVIDMFDSWGVTQTGLFTFAGSPRHLGLYQKFGFRPRALTLIMDKAIPEITRVSARWTPYSSLDEHQRGMALEECRSLTDAIYPNLDVTPEVRSIHAQSLGETVLIGSGGYVGFAACHTGGGSEAGSGVCYVKFGAVSPRGPSPIENFLELLAACEAFAADAGATMLIAGVNAARTEAYEAMLAAGFRILRAGVAMHRPNRGGFSRPGAFVMDDWR
jgi:GNAT superfamily N-acetyltransferase